jgi:hypothetical protein
MRMSEATRAGWARAKRNATMPPSEWPSRSARAMPAASKKASRSATS